jgi:hypothetical protein
MASSHPSGTGGKSVRAGRCSRKGGREGGREGERGK